MTPTIFLPTTQINQSINASTAQDHLLCFAAPSIMEKKKKEEQTKPLAASFSPSVAEEAATAGPDCPTTRRRGRRLLRCFLCFATAVAVAGLVILILSLTLLRAKNPTLSMTSLSIARIGVVVQPLSVNATLDAGIAIRNPNMASFLFGNSTTYFYYGGERVGVAYAAAGRVRARRSATVAMRVDVLVDRVATRLDLAVDFLAGADLRLASRTEIPGRINVMGLYKRDVEMELNCSMLMVISLARQEIRSTDCTATVR
ncbi:hypothetical protein ZIOFF_052189 [Zingiber officinale]|uniref:Late embryogenesis abundant protein LEA-2 subgroup domain-containing protein n=1 Tax=Zingiber officinale TaxID=94328 RepID=A0A8J5FU27_ZINOF|nr:hypothetical protein ZIOFF_052189 [Zingiber officinale]